AGRLNINQSYKIIQGGEQDSGEDAVAGPQAGHIAAYGFDYDPGFGGAEGNNATASYYFGTLAGGGKLTSTLAWNVPVTFAAGTFDPTAAPDFHSMELLLFDVTAGGLTPVASSSSLVDNTQSLWLDLA